MNRFFIFFKFISASSPDEAKSGEGLKVLIRTKEQENEEKFFRDEHGVEAMNGGEEVREATHKKKK